MKRLYRDIWTTNRDIARFAKKTKFWCGVCDHELVAQGKKCSYCGRSNDIDGRKRRYKMPVTKDWEGDGIGEDPFWETAEFGPAMPRSDLSRIM